MQDQQTKITPPAKRPNEKESAVVRRPDTEKKEGDFNGPPWTKKQDQGRYLIK